MAPPCWSRRDIVSGRPHYYLCGSNRVSLGPSTMSILPRFGFGKDREAEVLQQRVSCLQAALSQCADVAARWTEFRRAVTAAIAVLMLALGFTLGVYREPILHAVTRLAQSVVLATQDP